FSIDARRSSTFAHGVRPRVLHRLPAWVKAGLGRQKRSASAAVAHPASPGSRKLIMATAQSPSPGPDFVQGVPAEQLADGCMLAGRVGEEPALLFRSGDEFFAVGATCTHYGGPLAKGIVAGDTVRCPWHHACFSLKTGEALQAPAFSPLPRWRI